MKGGQLATNKIASYPIVIGVATLDHVSCVPQLATNYYVFEYARVCCVCVCVCVYVCVCVCVKRVSVGLTEGVCHGLHKCEPVTVPVT